MLIKDFFTCLLNSKSDLFEDFVAFLLRFLVVIIVNFPNNAAFMFFFLCIHLCFSSLHLLFMETPQLLQFLLQAFCVSIFYQV